MKRILLLPLLLAGCVFAQNWRPFRAHDHLFYRADTAAMYSHEVFVTAADTAAGDSVFTFNTEIRQRGYGSNMFRFMPQFIRAQAVKAADGAWIFTDSLRSFVLYPHAQPGAQWLFDLDSTLTATVLSATEVTTFGVPDSVKQLLIAGDTLVLSKQYGIVRFPALWQEPGYTLTGVRGAERVGQYLPDVFDFYDFEPGDVWYNTGGNSSYYGHGQGYNSGTSEKWTVLSRTQNGDTLEYQLKRLFKAQNVTHQCCGRPDVTTYDCGEDTSRFKVYAFPPGHENHLPPLHGGNPIRSTAIRPVMYASVEGGQTIYATSPGCSIDSQKFPEKGYIFYYASNGDLYNTDSSPENFTAMYVTGLGCVRLRTSEASMFPKISGYTVTAYQKVNGRAYGIVPHDSLLQYCPEGIFLSPETSPFPNPADALTTVTVNNVKATGTVELMDITGKRYGPYQLSAGSARLETADLPAGLYLLRITTGQEVVTQKLVIQH